MGCTTSAAVAVGVPVDDEIVLRAAFEKKRSRVGSKSEVESMSTSPSYKLQETLGQGAFGVVCAAVSDASQKARAIKLLPLSPKNAGSVVDPSLLADAEKEAAVWSQVRRHPHVVELLKVFKEDNKFCMVMDQCNGGTLADRKGDFYMLAECQAASIFREMLWGLEHVHACGVVHRDIKPANFLFGGPHNTTVKLADFGLAAVNPPSGKLFGVYGTPPYMSPEMASKQGHSFATDVWSVGATCYTLFLGQYPYAPYLQNGKTKGECFKDSIAKNANGPTYCRVVPASAKAAGRTHRTQVQPSKDAIAFLRLLMHRDAATRVTAEVAAEHPFLEDPDLNADYSYDTSCSEGKLDVASRMVHLSV